MRKHLDTAKLAGLITEQRQREHLTDADVARQTGLSTSTICRVQQGQRPDADGLLSLLAWLRMPAAAVCRETPAESDRVTY